MRTTEINLTNNIMKLLNNKKINYFSFSLFKNQQLTMSYSNNQDWFDYSNKPCSEIYQQALQQYVFCYKLSVLNWSLLTLDKNIMSYLQRRNKIVGANTMISILYKQHQHLVLLTLGTKQKPKYLNNFLINKAERLIEIAKYLMNQQI